MLSRSAAGIPGPESRMFSTTTLSSGTAVMRIGDVSGENLIALDMSVERTISNARASARTSTAPGTSTITRRPTSAGRRSTHSATTRPSFRTGFIPMCIGSPDARLSAHSGDGYDWRP
jgi:hypothetical protein